MPKPSVKRRFYLLIAASSFLFRNWSVRKKLHFGFASLILVLAFNVILTSYEISRLKETGTNLSYLVYLDLIGIVTGCLFIWIISQSVLRPMKRIIHQLENKASLESLRLYSNDEIGQLARAVSSMKKRSLLKEKPSDEKNLLLETILSHSIESIFIFNEEGVLTTFSKGFRSITRYNRKNDPHENISDIFLNLDLKAAFNFLSSNSQNAPFYKQRVALKTKKGKNYPLDCSICRVSGNNNQIYIGILKELQTSVKIKEKLSSTLQLFMFKKSKQGIEK